MKHDDTSKPFPISPEEVAAAISAAPERVEDPESPYNPNDPVAVNAFWKDALVRRPGQRGQGKKAKKVLLSIRYSPEVIEYFKATGEGWQRRMDDVLKEWVESNQRTSPEQRLTPFTELLYKIISSIGQNRPLKRLAKIVSEMERAGKLRSDFPAVGGGSEVQLVEKTFRSLISFIEESERARERSYVEAVGAIVAAADARDHETTSHSFRVALYAVSVAKILGIQDEELKAIEWGALLHDVGKMMVPDEILRKSGPLNDEEWHVMKMHPTWGFDMLSEVSFLTPTSLDIIYCHHERWDGLGYPRGLAGESIPLGARLFAVVDTYDAITSDHPYRRAHSHAAAIKELQRVAGQQLDPVVVETFTQIPEVELRRLRDLCRHVHPGLSLPFDLLDRSEDTKTGEQAKLGA